MLIKTRIEYSLKITNPSEIYSPTPEETILEHLRTIYEKKCMNLIYVKKLHRIIKRSLPNVIKRDNANCAVRTNIIVEADVIKYDTYDIIVGCKVFTDPIQKGTIDFQSAILCKNDHAAIMINTSDKLSSIQKDQIIPVVVGGISYGNQKHMIRVNAYPFIPIIQSEVIYKIEPLSEENKQYLQESVYSQLNKVLEEREEILKDSKKKKRWDFFNDLMYPYKKPKDVIEKKIKHSFFPITDMEQSGYIIQSSKHPMHHMECIRLESEPDTFIIEKSINVYEIYIMNVMKFIDVINKLTLCYENDTVFQSHQNIFNIYKDNKYE